MTKTRSLITVLIAGAAVAILGTGCQTNYNSEAKVVTEAWGSGQADLAAKEFAKQAALRDKSKDSVIWHLEAGAALRAAGNYPESCQHLDAAVAKMDQYEEQGKVKVGHILYRLLLYYSLPPPNNKELPYEGRSYDKIMAHTYIALNYLAAGEIDKAGPEVIHAYQCQQDAVEENKRRIEEAQEAENNGTNQATIKKIKADPAFDQRVEEVNKDLEGFKFYADYVNPFTVYLDGLYFLHAGTGRSDLERARKSLSRLIEVTGSNKFVLADLQLAENGGNTQPTPCTYVIFETGEAASQDQRNDMPSLPKLVFHQNHATELTVKAGEVEERTAVIANVDSIIAQDFKNEWPKMLMQFYLSNPANLLVPLNNKLDKLNQYLRKINHEPEPEQRTYEFAAHLADTRSWTTLPKEFQIARVATPTDRKLVLSTPGSAPVDVNLLDGMFNVVYVRSVNASSPLLVSQFKLK